MVGVAVFADMLFGAADYTQALVLVAGSVDSSRKENCPWGSLPALPQHTA